MISTGKQIDDVLLAKIQAAGHAVWIEDGALLSTNDAAVQAIVDNYTLAEAKAAACAKVIAIAKQKRDAVVASVSAGELASWSIKLSEARAYQASGSADAAPMLAIEAMARGISLDTMVAKVIGNASVFSGLEAAIGGTDGRHRDAINALPDWAALYAYDYTAGWPV